MKLYKAFICVFCLQITITLQAQEEFATFYNDSINKIERQIFKVSVSSFAQVSNNDNNPFWFYANRNGLFDRETTFASMVNTVYKNRINENQELNLGAGLAYKNGLNNLTFIDELFLSYSYNLLTLDVGIKRRDYLFNGVSSIGGDILWSRNARDLPGVNIKTRTPFKIAEWLEARGNFAHYEFLDDRFVDSAKLHHKSLFFDIKISEKQKLTAGLVHYVQWGGDSPEFGNQSISIRDFAKIIFGGSGGTTRNDQINTLGNHLGSYRLNYQVQKATYDLELYHQSIFDDRSGRELNNFPDGSWGIYLKPKRIPLVKGVLYEYIQTVSQSGRPTAVEGENQQSGGDNYFNNTVYRSGWTYFGQTIGLPFLTPGDDNLGIIQNRSFVHHVGMFGDIWKLKYKLKATYEKKLGNYSSPIIPNEKAFYSTTEIIYSSKYGDFSTQIGIDYSSFTKESLGVGIAYTYNFIKSIKNKKQ